MGIDSSFPKYHDLITKMPLHPAHFPSKHRALIER